MDNFEGVICTLLEAEGYWIRRSHRVNLTKEEKAMTGRPTIPRPEIDILAYKFATNEVIALEVKSYLDSQGTKIEHLREEHDLAAGRYKMFTSERYRAIVLRRLHQDLLDLGMGNGHTTIRLGLACGKIQKALSEEVRDYLTEKAFFFWSPEDIKARVLALAKSDYKNDTATMVAKILMRG